MNSPRINNDDRGITLNKAAAGLALVVSTISILGAGLLVSNAFRDVQNDVQQLEQRLDEQASDRTQYRRDVEARLRGLELARVGNDERLANALSLLTTINSRLERIEEYYRRQP